MYVNLYLPCKFMLIYVFFAGSQWQSGKKIIGQLALCRASACAYLLCLSCY